METTKQIKELSDLCDWKDREIRRLHKVALNRNKKEDEWNYFIAHLYRGLTSEILGPFESSTERGMKIKELQELSDQGTNDYIPLNIQGKVKKIQMDTIFRSVEDETKIEYKTFIQCDTCGRNYEKEALNFLVGMGDEGNTTCPACSKESDTLTKKEIENNKS